MDIINKDGICRQSFAKTGRALNLAVAMDQSSDSRFARGNVPPLPPAQGQAGKPGMRQGISILLSLFIALFLADGLVSLLDDSLILLFGVRTLTGLRAILFMFAIILAIVVYLLIGLTPMIPKRWFLPLTLFSPIAFLISIPLFIYFYSHIQRITWAISLTQVLVGIGILCLIRHGSKFQWPLITAAQLKAPRFSWINLFGFLLVNVLVFLPGTVAYLGACSSFAVNHFSDGFVGLRSSGLTVQMRKYVNNEGKTIQLFPVAHIGDAAFYQKLSQSFPTNSIILAEGVTDTQGLLTNKISYKRAAASLGLAEQQQEFKPTQGEVIRADIDIEEFAPETIALLNLAMLFHTQEMSPELLLKLMQYSPPPGFERKLFDDLLRKRNRHLLNEIESHLAHTGTIIVPWGAAHMPEIARELQKSGFRLKETEDFVVIRFGSNGK